MQLAALFCFCISAASAVKHYGLTPTEDVRNIVNHRVQAFSGDVMNLTSLFTTDALHNHDGADFLAAELGIFNKTLADVFPPHTSSSGHNSIQARAIVEGQCQGHGKIEDNLSSLQINSICYSLAGAAASPITAIIGVIDSNACVESSSGHSVGLCKTIFMMINTAGTTFTGGMVSTYCPAFLSFFVKCKGADAQAHPVNNKDIDMTAFNTQKDRNCDGPTGGEKCTEVHV